MVNVGPTLTQRLHQGQVTLQTRPAKGSQPFLVHLLQLCPFAQLQGQITGKSLNDGRINIIILERFYMKGGERKREREGERDI
jgi:hypothetical protein